MSGCFLASTFIRPQLKQGFSGQNFRWPQSAAINSCWLKEAQSEQTKPVQYHAPWHRKISPQPAARLDTHLFSSRLRHTGPDFELRTKPGPLITRSFVSI
ncbi:unnamed protein product [Eretmochelys imbricata]